MIERFSKTLKLSCIHQKTLRHLFQRCQNLRKSKNYLLFQRVKNIVQTFEQEKKLDETIR